jgi:hypothetical protein
MLKKYKINTFKYFKTTYFNNHLIYFNMKKLFLFCAVLFAACASSLNVQAQTDVTATYLTNAGFDTNCNFLASTAASNLGSGSTNNQAINGWTLTGSAANSASSTFEYGYLGTLNLSGTLYGFIPTKGPDAATGAGHGALGVSAAWGSTVTYYQTVTLPAGKYSIQYSAYNSGPTAVDYSAVGWVPATGTSVLSAKTTFTMGAWDTETLNFTVATATTGKIQVGIGSPNSGSGTVGRIFFDNIILNLLPVDKTTLLQLKDSANVMYNNQQPVSASSTVYADLNTAITAAQVILDNTGATADQVLGQEVTMKTAIANVYSAILLQSRISTWTPLPYNATSVIINPSFETAISTGWTNVGGFALQSNTSFSKKDGTNYVENWKAAPGIQAGLKLSQTVNNIPNGIYLLTASAMATQQSDGTFPGGAFIYANDQQIEVFATNDYAVTVTVTNNTLEFGYNVVSTGNWVAVDNFRLSYISNGSPYVVLTPGSLFFDANNLTKPIAVSGGNLTSNLVLSAPAGITLDKTVLTPAQVAAGITVNATFDNATAITNGTISATTGTLTQNVTVNASADLTCFTPLYPSLTNIIPNPYLNDISGFGGWGHVSVVYGQAYCGAACVMMNALTNTYPDGAALDVSTVNWAPNSTYRLHAWVKTVDGTFAFLAKGTDPDVTISVAQSTDQWVLIDQTFTTGAAPTASFFTFNNVDGASTGKIAYIDNYELYNITSLVATSTENPADNQNQKVYIHENKIVVDFGLTESSNVEFSVYNPQGMLISSEKEVFAAGQNQKLINANLPSGVYMVKMSSNGLSFTTKVIK